MADVLAKKVAALESLAELRPAPGTEVGRIEARTNEIRQEIFRARLGDPLSESLVDEVNGLRESIEPLDARFEQALVVAKHVVLEPAPRFRLRFR